MSYPTTYQTNDPRMDFYRRRILVPNDLYNSGVQASNNQDINYSNQNTLTPNSLYNYQPQAYSGETSENGSPINQAGNGGNMDYGSYAQMVMSAIQTMQNNKNKQFGGNSVPQLSLGGKPLFQPQISPLRMSQQQQMPGFLSQLLSTRR